MSMSVLFLNKFFCVFVHEHLFSVVLFFLKAAVIVTTGGRCSLGDEDITWNINTVWKMAQSTKCYQMFCVCRRRG